MQQKVGKNTRRCPGRAALIRVKCRCGAGVWDLTDGPTNLLFNARANIGPADYQHLIVLCVGKDYVKQKPPGCGATLRQGPTGSRYPTRPELFFKYPTRPDPKIENDWVPGN